MSFINDDFLLTTEPARRLYHQFAVDQPILDYHNHLPPDEIAVDRRFANLYEIWLEGDHYKWRAMRANGVGEAYCMGDAPPYEKFLAWARTVPHTLRNPLYHWTHLELKRAFGIDDLLNEATAPSVWEEANARLQDDDMSIWGLLDKFKVKALCTTDDPADSLEHHQSIASSALATKVYPAYRPDKALTTHQPEGFNAWLETLAAASDTDINSYQALLTSLKKRHDFFHEQGCRLSDHGVPYCYSDVCSDAEAERIFAKVRGGEAASPSEQAQFAANLMLEFGRWDAERGWTLQLHIGPLRNNSTRKFNEVGPDGGFDSMGDWPQMESMSTYFDRLDRDDMLPKTIVYNLNPVNNYAFATMVGNFQDGRTPGKMQFGSGWWYLDQREGMEWQMNTLSNVGLLSRFVGMLTDSRSFVSFTRHEYFRRTLCNMLGRDIVSGEIPDDDGLIGPMIQNICYGNAAEYLGLEL